MEKSNCVDLKKCMLTNYLASLVLSRKVSLHHLHLKGLWPEWSRLCTLRWIFWLNGNSNRCNRIIKLRWSKKCMLINYLASPVLSRKVSQHHLHLKGLWPECSRLCTVRWIFWLNLRWHTLHWYARTPEWIVLCFISVSFLRKTCTNIMKNKQRVIRNKIYQLIKSR